MTSSMSPEAKRPRRRIFLLGALALVALAATAAGVFLATRDQGDVSNPDVEFRADPSPVPTATPRTDRDDDSFVWGHYGYSKDRRRAFAASASLRPPYHRVWAETGRILLEFSPVIGGKLLYLLKNNAALYGISKRTGRVAWKKKLGYLAAASPAYGDGVVYVTILQRGKTNRRGRVSALRARDGKPIWTRLLPSRSESSPLLDGGRLYFGSESGRIYALDAKDGSVDWTYEAGGSVKGGLALDAGKLYFGDYKGRVHAIRASNGSKVWQTGTKGARFGLSSGNFYSTPAVAYGRVYIGNTDGNVYSFASSSGKLAWRKSTGGFVYASPAVATFDGKPTVYIGSYSGRFYALDAKSGRPRWVHSGQGKISGGATIIGDIVYYANLSKKATVGLGARTGRRVFDFGRGSFHPVVSDGRTIFLTGYSSLYALRPLTAEGQERVKASAKRRRTQRVDRQRDAARRDARLQSACRERAERLHARHSQIVRSFRKCVRRERKAATRAACRRRALTVNGGRGPYLRSLRRCIHRH
jgi:outer membrane protein assembly factor BamB